MKPRTLLVVLAGLACATAQAAPQAATDTDPNQPATQPAPDNQPAPEAQPAQPEDQPAQANQQAQPDQNQAAQPDEDQPAPADPNAQPNQQPQPNQAAQPDENQPAPVDPNAQPNQQPQPAQPQPNQPGQAQANQPAPAGQNAPATGAPATAGMGMTGTRPRRMANCPSALPGASTTVKDTADGVELQITAQDPGVQQRLVKLAHFHAMLQFPNWFVKPHSGLGGGPGTIGFCPIVHQDTALTYAPIANGVTIHVVTAPDKVSALQRETHARVNTLQSRPAS